MPRYIELGRLANALGVSDDQSGELRILREGFSIVVSLRIDSGVVRGVDLHVANRGWPEADFRRETEGDRAAKRGGMNVEVQTGDKTFDDFVYIESPYAEAVLAPLLQSPALRRAIGDLVAQYSRVSITASSLTVDTRNAGTELLEPARFLPLLDGVLAVAKLFPAVPRAAPKRADRGGGLMLAAGANVLVSAILPAVLVHYGTPDSARLRAIGLGIGLVLALVSIPIVRVWTRGHSRSTTYFAVTTVANVIALPLLMMSAAVVANAALDSAPAEKLAGKVTKAEPYLDDGEPRAKVTVAWSTHAVETLDLKDPRPVGVKVGDAVRAIRHPGALGFVWWELEPEIAR